MNVGLRGSELAGIVLDPQGLAGNVCVAPSQLLGLAHVFGLEVRSLDDEGPVR